MFTGYMLCKVAAIKQGDKSMQNFDCAAVTVI